MRSRGGSGAYTNKPLVALNNVILTVASGKRARAAFSESPLPFILKVREIPFNVRSPEHSLCSPCLFIQNSLGGKTLTVVLATVSPAVSAYDDTLETFQLIARAKAVKNDVKRNVDSTASLIKDIQAEVDAMKEQAARTPALGAKPGVEAVLPEKVVALEATIETLQRARLNVGSQFEPRESILMLLSLCDDLIPLPAPHAGLGGEVSCFCSIQTRALEEHGKRCPDSVRYAGARLTNSAVFTVSAVSSSSGLCRLRKRTTRCCWLAFGH